MYKQKQKQKQKRYYHVSVAKLNAIENDFPLNRLWLYLNLATPFDSYSSLLCFAYTQYTSPIKLQTFCFNRDWIHVHTCIHGRENGEKGFSFKVLFCGVEADWNEKV